MEIPTEMEYHLILFVHFLATPVTIRGMDGQARNLNAPQLLPAIITLPINKIVKAYKISRPCLFLYPLTNNNNRPERAKQIGVSITLPSTFLRKGIKSKK